MLDEEKKKLAYQHFQEGRYIFKSYSKEGNARAIDHFIAAKDLDPNFVRAISWLAYAHLESYRENWTANPAATASLAEDLANEAVRLARDDYYTHWTLASVYMITQAKDPASAQQSYEDAAARDISGPDPDFLAERSEFISCQGNPDKAIADIETAKLLKPDHPGWYHWLHAFAYFQKRDYAKASSLLKAMSNMPNTAYILLAICEYNLEQVNPKLGKAIPKDVIIERLKVKDPQWSKDNLEKIPFKETLDEKHYWDSLKNMGLT